MQVLSLEDTRCLTQIFVACKVLVSIKRQKSANNGINFSSYNRTKLYFMWHVRWTNLYISSLSKANVVQNEWFTSNNDK